MYLNILRLSRKKQNGEIWFSDQINVDYIRPFKKDSIASLKFGVNSGGE